MRQVMKEELTDECNYTREAACMRSFGSPERLGADGRFKVPWVWEGSTDRVLVMEHMDGTSDKSSPGGPKRGAFPAAVPSSTSWAKLT
jgi:predicted unusual protein kinase regulating ubiquinone biosynthesis (AarF/ABC1/UbiB family)